MYNNKRKIIESNESKPKNKPKLKRAGTMETTALEGNEFLEQEGAVNLAKTPGGREGVETRGKQQARTTVNSLLSTKKDVIELAEADKEKEENKLKMVFRLFDNDKDGLLNAEELTDALRSCGKKPTKAKITALLESVSNKKKNNAITSDEFVAYMMAKMFKKEKKAEEKTASSSPKTEKKTPVKKGEKEQEKKKESDGGKQKEDNPKEAPAEKKEAEKEKEPETIKPMERARSITEFCAEHFGMNTEVVAEKLDESSNLAGVEYDLGHEGACNGFKILVGSFCDAFTKERFENKEFEFVYTTTEAEFYKSLPNCDIAWIFHNSPTYTFPEGAEVAQARFEFYSKGGSLYIWGDNEQILQHPNAVSIIAAIVIKSHVDHKMKPGLPLSRVAAEV